MNSKYEKNDKYSERHFHFMRSVEFLFNIIYTKKEYELSEQNYPDCMFEFGVYTHES